ncbi:MAG: zf-HC2 domain-containing protein [Tepidisphaeraceae bacterium]
MSHPNVEELTDFLYGELAPAHQMDVTRHVEACAECRQRIESWRETRTNLAAWKLRPASRLAATSSAARWTGALRWTAAAVVLLACGYGVARLTAKPAVDLASLRAELAREVRQEVREELTTELARYADKQSVEQREFQEAMVQAVSKLQTRQVVDHASLREDVETVALQAERRFAQLALHENAGVAPQSEQ